MGVPREVVITHPVTKGLQGRAVWNWRGSGLEPELAELVWELKLGLSLHLCVTSA